MCHPWSTVCTGLIDRADLAVEECVSALLRLTVAAI
jgi:hypothetical protein